MNEELHMAEKYAEYMEEYKAQLTETFHKYEDILINNYSEMNIVEKKLLQKEMYAEVKAHPMLGELQLGQDQRNLGMLAVSFDIPSVASLILENPIASTQQDINGWNIGMCAAARGMGMLTRKAYANRDARNQVNTLGNNIEYYAKQSKVFLPRIKADKDSAAMRADMAELLR